MKKIITLLILFCSVVVSAQTIQDNTLTFRGGKYFQYGKLLSLPQLKNTIGEEAYFSQYEKGFKLRKAGIITTSVGGGIIVASGIIYVVGISSAVSEESTSGSLRTTTNTGLIGGYTALVGGATLIGGLICLFSGNHRLKDVAKTYNLNNGRQISLAPASNGLGLALRF